MKKLLLVITLVLFCGVLAQPECKINVAVADFYGQNVSEAEAVTVSDFFRSAMVNLQQFNVLERKNMALVLAEQSFQLSGCTDQECAVKMGKLLNVEKVVTGKLTRFEPYYYINAQIIDVESGRIEASEKIQCKKKTALPDKAEEFALLVTEVMTGKRQPRQITYTTTSRVFAGAGLGMLNASDVSLSVPLSRMFFGYRFSPSLAGVFAYSTALNTNETEYMHHVFTHTHPLFPPLVEKEVRYSEVINSFTSVCLDIEYLLSIGRKNYLVGALGPVYSSFVVKQSFNAVDGTDAGWTAFNVPGITTTTNRGLGFSTRCGFRYYVTQGLSIEIQGIYTQLYVQRQIDFKSTNNEALRPDLDHLQKTYMQSGIAGLLGVTFDF